MYINHRIGRKTKRKGQISRKPGDIGPSRLTDGRMGVFSNEAEIDNEAIAKV